MQGVNTLDYLQQQIKKEVYSADVALRNNIVDLLSTRRQNRRTRRNRLRYRKARFNNRVKSKHKSVLYLGDVQVVILI